MATIRRKRHCSLKTGYIKYITDEEFGKIQDWVNAHCNLKWRTIFGLLMYSGLRVSEVVSLKRSNFVSSNILVLKLAKSSRIHERVIHPKIVPLLSEYIQFFKIGYDDYLFPPDHNNANNHTNPYIDPQSVRTRLGALRKQMGLGHAYATRVDGSQLQRISVHSFRNRFISKVYEATGKDLIATQRIIGHKRCETTEHYITPSVCEADIISRI